MDILEKNFQNCFCCEEPIYLENLIHNENVKCSNCGFDKYYWDCEENNNDNIYFIDARKADVKEYVSNLQVINNKKSLKLKQSKEQKDKLKRNIEKLEEE